jgi:hypothetical protein
LRRAVVAVAIFVAALVALAAPAHAVSLVNCLGGGGSLTYQPDEGAKGFYCDGGTYDGEHIG